MGGLARLPGDPTPEPPATAFRLRLAVPVRAVCRRTVMSLQWVRQGVGSAKDRPQERRGSPGRMPGFGSAIHAIE